MTIAPLDLILLLGTVQGFILAGLLWFSQSGHRLSNRLLGALLFLLALMSFAMSVPLVHPWMSTALDLFPWIMVMPLGPLMYFYTQSVLDTTFRLRRAERFHFYAIVLDWGKPIIGWTFVIGWVSGLILGTDGPAWGRAMQEYDTYADIPRWLSLTTYLILTRRKLAQFDQSAQLTGAVQRKRRWLRQFTNGFIALQLIWLSFMLTYLIPGWRVPLMESVGWHMVYIPITGLIYWLGLRGFLWARHDTEPTPAKPNGPELAPKTVAHANAALTHAMTTDRLYLNSELTLDKLARHTQLTPKLISAVLNQHRSTNFNGFVNGYRVDAVKQRLNDPAHAHLTLTGIAFECGFNSQATFQRAFRQATGLSPREYAQQQGKNNTQIQI